VEIRKTHPGYRGTPRKANLLLNKKRLQLNSQAAIFIYLFIQITLNAS